MKIRAMAVMWLAAMLLGISGCGASPTEGEATANIQPAPFKVAPGRVVSMHFSVHDVASGDDGKPLETSAGGEPFQFLFGQGTLPTALEEKMLGLTAGESLEATLAPPQAFGHRDEALVVQVPREKLANIENLQPGMQLMADRQFPVTVLEVGENLVTIDENHPWAGLTLRYNVEVVAVRNAEPEEVAHGHVHGPGGVEHEP
ncbi:MAG: peptidylprolyl isomerase [Pirellulaceae bacterium]